MTLKSYLCWVGINAIGLVYFVTFVWVLFNPDSYLHLAFLFLHLLMSCTLLGIFFAALAHIKCNTPALNDPRWHEIGRTKGTTMPIDMNIQFIN